MARLRHFLISIGVSAALAGCGPAPDSAPVAAPAASASVAASAPGEPAKPEQTESPEAAQKAEAETNAALASPDWRKKVPNISAREFAATLRAADQALIDGRLDQHDGSTPGALELYLAVLAVDPANLSARAGLQASIDALIERGRIATRAGQLREAERIVRIASSLLPEHPDLQGFRGHLAAARQAADWVAKAETAARAGHYIEPLGASALDYFQRAEAAYPDFEPARQQRRKWNSRLLQQASKAAAADDFGGAEKRLLESERFLPGSSEARVVGLRIVELRQARTQDLLKRGNAAVDRLRLDRAEELRQQVEKIAAQPYGTEALAERIHLARHYGPFKPGESFSDKLRSGGRAPEMVVVRYGKFRMGAIEDDPVSQDSERPAHQVEFKRGFAIARNEVTVAEFRRFVQATGYRSVATRAGHSTVYDEKGGVFSEHEGVDWRKDHVGRVADPQLPAVHLAWRDAVAYAAWLSTETGQEYRLPSEAEFEYALRAGSQELYPWGSGSPTAIVGNLTGDGDLSRTGRRWSNAIPRYRDAFWGPAPARTFPEERFGTYDMIGNVMEWTLDCWHESYQRAPVDGTAWVNPGCPERVARGASWGSSLENARSSARQAMPVDTTTARMGFRIVREI